MYIITCIQCIYKNLLRVDGEVQYAYEVYSGPEARAIGSALHRRNHLRVMLTVDYSLSSFLGSISPDNSP